MKRENLFINILGLCSWLGAAFVAGALGAVASINAAGFYAQLNRPDWAPSANVFGPVWTLLYVLMGIAAWLVWRRRNSPLVKIGLVLFVIQLLANALWSWLFFGWHLGALAFIEVLILLALIMATTVIFWRVRTLAGFLMMPYLLWVAFASVLNLFVWLGNPSLL